MKEIVNTTLGDVAIKRLLKAQCGLNDIPSLTSTSYLSKPCRIHEKLMSKALRHGSASLAERKAKRTEMISACLMRDCGADLSLPKLC